MPKASGILELTDNIIRSRNPTTSPTLAFASVSSVFKEQLTPIGIGHTEPTSGSVGVLLIRPAAPLGALGATDYATDVARKRQPPASFSLSRLDRLSSAPRSYLCHHLAPTSFEVISGDRGHNSIKTAQESRGAVASCLFAPASSGRQSVRDPSRQRQLSGC